MRAAFEKTLLPQPILNSVWALVNPSNKENFDFSMFAMAMQLLAKNKEGA